MSAKSVPPLTLVLSPSRRLAWALGLCHGLAAFSAVANPLPWGLRGAVLATVLSSAAMAWQRLWRKLPVRQLRVDETGEWSLWTASGDEVPVSLLPGSVVVSPLILLHFRGDSGRFRAVPVLPDSLESDGFRRLTVRLRTWTPPL